MNNLEQAPLQADAGSELVTRSQTLLSNLLEAGVRLFPNGVQALRVQMSIHNVGSVELELNGSGSTLIQASTLQETEERSLQRIVKIEKEDWRRGEPGELRIEGEGFTKPLRVRIPGVTTRGPRWDKQSADVIRVDIEVDQYGGKTCRDVEVYFEDGRSIVARGVFMVT